MPKYSIIIPTYNGMPYLKSCINTIINQQYDDYELIISNNHSTDNTPEYLESIKNNEKIMIISPPQQLSMAEHWEWALQFASGEWQIFVGSDDGLQPYFFTLADKLTAIAEKKHLKAIMSERAYYFWEGCEEIYGAFRVSYTARYYYKTKKCIRELKKSLFIKNKAYFDLPEMYTTALFHKDIIEKAKKVQNGKVFITHPQDANLAALFCILEKKYLYSYVPLGWVGSSVKSAGYATTIGTKDSVNDNMLQVKEYYDKYQKSIENSKLCVSANTGYYLLFNNHTCLWNAVILVNEIMKNKHYSFVSKKITAYKIVSLIIQELDFNNITKFDSCALIDLIKRNKLNVYFLSFFIIIEKFNQNIIRKKYILNNYFDIIVNKLFSISISQYITENDISFENANIMIMNLVDKKILKFLKRQ